MLKLRNKAKKSISQNFQNSKSSSQYYNKLIVLHQKFIWVFISMPILAFLKHFSLLKRQTYIHFLQMKKWCLVNYGKWASGITVLNSWNSLDLITIIINMISFWLFLATMICRSYFLSKYISMTFPLTTAINNQYSKGVPNVKLNMQTKKRPS